MHIAVVSVMGAHNATQSPSFMAPSNKGLDKAMNKNPTKKRPAVRTRKKTAPKKEQDKPSAHATASADVGRFGGIMNKSLELAQASINLGLNLVQEFGASFQGDLLHKLAEAGKSVFAAKQSGMAAQNAEASQPDSAAAEDPGQPSEKSDAITNRLPLFPGSSVRIPFSINNDTTGATKTVHVHLEGFAGELTGATLKADHFSISPVSKEIVPMDFEKFVIAGTLPINCRGDAYRGFIIVTGTESMKIPVKIVVMSRT
jgi:hypothetical protein